MTGLQIPFAIGVRWGGRFASQRLTGKLLPEEKLRDRSGRLAVGWSKRANFRAGNGRY